MKPRLLIVEDSATLQTAMRLALAPHFEIDQATTFADVETTLGKARPDLIILDINFDRLHKPGDILDVADRIHGKGIPCVAISGDPSLLKAFYETDDRVRFGLQKSFNEAQLLEVVRTVLREEQAAADARAAQVAPVGAAGSASAASESGAGELEFPTDDEGEHPLDDDELDPMDPINMPRHSGSVADAMGVLDRLRNSQAPLPVASAGRPATSAPEPPDRFAEGHDVRSAGVLLDPARVMDDPGVRRAIAESLVRSNEFLSAVVARAPAEIAPLSRMIQWALGVRGSQRYSVLALCPEETVLIHVCDRQVMGVESDAWPNDDRIEAMRGRTLPPPGALDGFEQTDDVQAEAIIRAAEGAAWIEIRRATSGATAWADGQPSAHGALTAMALSLDAPQN